MTTYGDKTLKPPAHWLKELRPKKVERQSPEDMISVMRAVAASFNRR